MAVTAHQGVLLPAPPPPFSSGSGSGTALPLASGIGSMRLLTLPAVVLMPSVRVLSAVIAAALPDVSVCGTGPLLVAPLGAGGLA